MYYTRTSTVMVRTIWISIRDRPFAKLAKIFTSFAAGTSSEAGVQTGWKWNRWMATHWHFLPTAQFFYESRYSRFRILPYFFSISSPYGADSPFKM